MATFLDLATDALVTCGEVGAGEPISAEDGAYCLLRFNSMIDSWSIDRPYLYTEGINAYPLVSSKTTYQMGPSGADIVAVRPAQISQANILVLFNGVYISAGGDLDLITSQAWQALSDTVSSSGNIPEKLYVDFAYPNLNLNLFPKPLVAVGTKIQLRTWTPLTQIANTAVTMALPPGYYEAMVTNLGIAILDGYNKPVPPVLSARAVATLERVKNLNALNALAPMAPPPAAPPQ